MVRAAEEGRPREEIIHLFGVSRHHQTLRQTTTRNGRSGSKADSRPSGKQRGRLTRGFMEPVGGQPRGNASPTLPDVGRNPWATRERSDDGPRYQGPGLDTKKKSVVASERDEEKRAAWRVQAGREQHDEWVFVDECATHIALTPLYARAPRGVRAGGSVPRNYGKKTTLIASLSLSGMGEAFILEGSADAPAFEVYIEQVLAPSLHCGQTVVMDNLNTHQGERVRQAIEAKGCRLLYLPSYSPDLSPIEPAFSKLKTFLRRKGARTAGALQQAIAEALDAITAQDARGWFTHCGYLAAEIEPIFSETQLFMAQSF